MPDDLPFPPGTYVMQELGLDGGYHKALMVLPDDLTTLTKFVLDQWPKSGYQLGRGDSELYEVEDVFTKAPSVGAFKAVSQPCSPGYSKMLLIYADQSPGLPVLPSPTGYTDQPERVTGRLTRDRRLARLERFSSGSTGRRRPRRRTIAIAAPAIAPTAPVPASATGGRRGG